AHIGPGPLLFCALDNRRPGGERSARVHCHVTVISGVGFSPAIFSVSRTASRVNLLHYAGLFQLLYNRQQNMSWVRTGVLNRLLGHSHLRAGPERFPGIGIAVELWKVTACDVHAN